MKSNLRKTKSVVLIACFALGYSRVSAAQSSSASADPNQLLAFKKIFVEKVEDNVDGAFQAPVEQSFKEVFERNPRFEIAADKANADTVIKTAVEKKTNGTELDITVTIQGTNEVFTHEHLTIPSKATGREAGDSVKQLLKAALKRIPFYGTITGRDGRQLTFDIGALHGLRKGDVIQISRIDNIKRHPLLKSIVDVQLVPVGNAQIDSIEDTISFGHIQSEITGESVQKLFKVTAIEAAAPIERQEAAPEDASPSELNGRQAEALPGGNSETNTPDRPQLGHVGLGPYIGSFSSSQSQASSGLKFSGGGLNIGFKLDGELWITKRWFADLMFGGSSVNYSQTSAVATSDPNPPTTSYSSSMTREFAISGGYKYLPNDDLYGPQIYAKIGYFNWAWNSPLDPAGLLTTRTYSSLNLGVGGVLPISSYDWGVLLDIRVLLFPSLSEGEGFKTGSNPSASGATFFLGGYHYFSPKIQVKAGFQVDIFSADFDNGSSSVSQKSFSFIPSLVYYF